MNTLDELFLKHSSDKGIDCHNYSKYYEMFFGPIKDSNVKLLEIGIFAGASLRAWREYFPNGEISGIDIRGDYEYLIDEGCKATYVVDQGDMNQLIAFNEAHRNEFDIIIDDGSHEANHQIQTFEILFTGLQKGGMYIIEDELTSYDKSRWGKNANVWDRIRQMVGEVSINGKVSYDCLCSNKVGEIHKYENNLNYYERNIEWIFVSYGMTIIKKMP
jgi:hypothetical protein